MASKYLRVSACASWLYHFIPKLTHSIQHLMEVLVDSLDGPPKGLVDNPKPLIVPYNM
jgi:hypothetical protein